MKYTIREIQPRDDAAVEAIIRTCLLEFGGNRPGTAWFDPGLAHFSRVYTGEARRYWVAEDETGRVVGGVGIGELDGEADVCELQKMYCLKEARGTGAANQLIDAALAFARGRFLLLFNFHWSDSHADWPLVVPPGDFRLRLDTDRPAFGGQGRIAQGQVFRAAWEIRDGQALPRIRVYLPSRTAMVLERVPGCSRRAPSIPKARRARRSR